MLYDIITALQKKCDPLVEYEAKMPASVLDIDVLLKQQSIISKKGVFGAWVTFLIGMACLTFLVNYFYQNRIPSVLHHAQLVTLAFIGLIAIPLSALSFANNMFYPPSLIISTSGVFQRVFGRISGMAWENIIEIQMKPVKVNIFGGTRAFR